MTSFVALSLAGTAHAQIAVGENVNMVSGRSWPGGDPYLQRQNEPTVAVSSASAQHLVAAANDYRTVDIPAADPGATIPGEAWLGVFKSLDGGQTWKSYLLPGFPQDPACAPAAAVKNPLCAIDGVPSPAAADPVARAGTDGMFYVAGLNFVRDRSRSRIFVARYLDRNDKENGDATVGTDPIPWIDTRIVYTAPAGIFVDKPWIAVDVPRAGAKTCTVRLPDGTRSFLGGTLYAGWAEFPATGPETSGNVKIASSSDCGETWSAPYKLNGVNSTISQGLAIAIEPVTGRVYVAWRRFASGSQTDAIMAARSAGRSKMFSTGRVVATLRPFDLNAADWQPMLRTSAFPSLAISSNGTSSWAHVAWQQRLASDESRVVVTSAAIHPPPAGDQDADDPEDRDAETRVTWSTPLVVDEPAAEPGTPTPHAHQLMPSLTFSQGRLVLTYYDSRLDHARRYYQPLSPFEPNAAGKFYDEALGPKGAVASGGQLYDPLSFAPIFDAALSDERLTQIRHTLDVRVAMAGAGGAPRFASSQVTLFAYGLRGDEQAGCTFDGANAVACPPVTIPTFGGGLDLFGGGTVPRYLQQLQLNPPNLLIFKKNRRAFLGDYIDVQGVSFVPRAGGGWAFATSPSAAPVFHAVWTTNQDVRLPPPCPVDLFAPDGTLVCRAGTPDWSQYTPIDPPAASRYDGSPTAGNACAPDRPNATGSRDQNVYTSRITEGLSVGSPQNVKPLDASVVRGFVVLARNSTQKPITVTFDVPAASAAPGLRYSWVNDAAAPVTSLPGIVVPPQSHVFRTLFVRLGTATDPLSTLVVNVTETGPCAATVPSSCRGGSVTLNPPNALATSLVQPDGSVIPISSREVYLPGFGPGVITDPNITSPNITSPTITSPNITSPNITSPNITSPNITSPNITSPNITSNPDVASIPAPNITSPNITSPNITSPNITSPNITSPNITSPNITSSTLSDASWEVTNEGNTTTQYHLKLVTTGAANALPAVRVIVTRTYTNPTAVGCELKEKPQSQLVSTAVVDLGTPGGAVVTPDAPVDPGAGDGSATNLTFALAPGETNVVTLRANLTLGDMLDLVTTRVRPVPVPASIVPAPGVTYATFPPPSDVPARTASATVLAFDRATSLGSVTVTGSGGTPTGLVTLVRGGVAAAAVVTLSAGAASFAIDPPLATGETLVAFYGGDARFLPSRSNAAQAGITTHLTLGANPAAWTGGTPVTFYATVTADGVTDLTALRVQGRLTPLVTFVVDGVSTPALFDAALPSVTAAFTTTLGPGPHRVEAHFVGVGEYLPSDSNVLSQAAAGFVPANPMLSPRKMFAAIPMAGTVWAVGGVGSTTSLEVLDLAGGSWAAGAATGGPAAGTELAAAGLAGRIYAFPEAGVTSVFDTAAQTWTSPGSAVPPLTGAFAKHAVTAQGRIFLVDGRTIREYLPASDTFVDRATPPWSAGGASRVWDEATEFGGRVYVIGGVILNALVDRLYRVDVYDPATDSWSRAANLPATSPWNFTAAAGAGGKLYVFGGENAVQDPVTLAYLMRQAVYDPATDTWQELPATQPHRYAASAVTVPGATGEHLLVLGGDDGVGTSNVVLNRVDAYYP